MLGDPLDIIASGPTIPDSATPRDALAVLAALGAREAGVPASIFAALERRAAEEDDAAANGTPRSTPSACRVTNHVIGNNAVAVRGAAEEARRRGYETVAEPGERLEGAAEALGESLAARAVQLRASPGRHCLISGGEPTVRLAPAERRGRGGRNQQLVLAALAALMANASDRRRACDALALLSGGTDGEDGPTDAAGAVMDARLCARLADPAHAALDPRDSLARNDAYHFFQPLDGLIITGPTHTNVCDVRVVVTECERSA